MTQPRKRDSLCTEQASGLENTLEKGSSGSSAQQGLWNCPGWRCEVSPSLSQTSSVFLQLSLSFCLQSVFLQSLQGLSAVTQPGNSKVLLSSVSPGPSPVQEQKHFCFVHTTVGVIHYGPLGSDMNTS